MQQHVLFLILLKISMLFQHDLVVLRHENWCYMCHFAGIHLFLGFMEFFQDYWWASNKFYLIRSLIFLCSRLAQRCLFTSKIKSVQIHTQFWFSSEVSWHFFSVYSVDSIYGCICLSFCKLLPEGINGISSNHIIWYLCELDLPAILPKETRSGPKRRSKWWIFIFQLLPRIFEVLIFLSDLAVTK